jgi:hypothetical protein
MPRNINICGPNLFLFCKQLSDSFAFCAEDLLNRCFCAAVLFLYKCERIRKIRNIGRDIYEIKYLGIYLRFVDRLQCRL